MYRYTSKILPLSDGFRVFNWYFILTQVPKYKKEERETNRKGHKERKKLKGFGAASQRNGISSLELNTLQIRPKHLYRRRFIAS
ncbi:hypothetical protein ANSO36C_19900 [Nostoc cf. commune SO-36]|uniref:Transposase n=1 Tax=Nostoc cf. commune SO-36 TaxID=449208 RepID=A0ABN6Q4B9_NOSCO|nr:hypothetical protein ANSO36C_19900 [Nostoc cf. commune SO-36]